MLLLSPLSKLQQSTERVRLLINGGRKKALASNFNFETMDIREVIKIDHDILGGQPVFAGTRVPVDTLFDHLETGVSLADFLEDFPSVKKEQAIALLDIASKIVTSKNITQLYEAVA